MGNSSERDFDVCIVGAGPAGIALALTLADGGKSVLLLESGAEEANDADESLNAVEADKISVGKSRARALGGTTKLWAGRWKMLNDIDFTKREEIPNSGWPFSHEELLPFYSEAAAFLSVPPLSYLKNISFSKRTCEVGNGKGVEPTMLWTIPVSEFDVGKRFRKRLYEHKNISVQLGLTVVHIESSSGHVTAIKAVTRAGEEKFITADQYILATGGIENARLLLVSGIGGPATGKYFMDHVKGVFASIIPNKDRPSQSAYEKEWLHIHNSKGDYRIGFRLTDAVQKEYGLVNPYVQLEPIYKPGLIYKILRKLGMSVPLTRIAVVSYFEQSSRKENQITLINENDQFGVPRARVSFDLSELDIKSMAKLHALLKERMQEMGIGTLTSDLLDHGESALRSKITDASHHMGTTRMGTDPDTSVVDANAKVHGIDNLYIAGSSVFPTGGHANPTAPLVALSFRLGHHLLND